MDNFFYTIVLFLGSMMAYYIFFVVSAKVVPKVIGGKPLSAGIQILIQILVPAFIMPMIVPGILKNLDNMFEITQSVGSSPYLSIITGFFESAEAQNRLWAVLSIAIFLLIFKKVIESMPDGTTGLGSFAISVVVIIFIATSSSVLWDLVAERIWLNTIQSFDRVWWETVPGNIIRQWWFPEQVRIVP